MIDTARGAALSEDGGVAAPVDGNPGERETPLMTAVVDAVAGGGARVGAS